MSMEVIKQKLNALADAMEISLTVDGMHVTGTSKRILPIFEGYSPTVFTNIEDSLIDLVNEVVVAQGQIWGNIGFVIVVERTRSQVSFFIYDRSKVTDPFGMVGGWSRRKLYGWLADCCKAVYYRSMFDTVWTKLPQAPQRLVEYNSAREVGTLTSKEAYMLVWGGTEV